MKCEHSDLRYRLGGKALICEKCKSEAEIIINDLRSEIERLRAWHAATMNIMRREQKEYCEEFLRQQNLEILEAAGRGEE